MLVDLRDERFLEFLVVAVLVGATLAMLLLKDARRHAYVPLAILVVGVSILLPLSVGRFLRGATGSEDPRCGLPLVIPLWGMLGLWTCSALLGCGLLLHPASRRTGKTVITRVIPLAIAAAVITVIVARWWP
jgi:hypothetical protein